MAGACGITLGDPAVALVDTGWNTFSLFAQSSFAIAKDQISALQQFTIDPYPFNVTFSDSDALTGYIAPTPPPAPDPASLIFDAVGDPGLPPVTTIGQVPFTNPPPADYGQQPSLNLGPDPGAFEVPPPGPAPALAPVIVPTAPDVVLPQQPNLLGINIPQNPNIVIPTFTAIAPIANFTVPDVNLNFTPASFEDDLLDEIKAQIQNIIATGLALPAAIQQALVDAAISRDDANQVRAAQEVREQFSKLGFDEPDGVLGQRLLEVTQTGQDTRGNIIRDQVIAQQMMQNKNIMDAIQQGVALESQLMMYQIRMQELLLDANKFLLSASIELFNARVSLFNAQTQAYGIQAQVFRDRIQAALAQVEIYKNQIDAQRLISEINAQTVEIYKAQIQAVLAQVQIFEAQVRAAVAQAEANRVVIEAYRATVEAFGEQVRAYTAEWEGFTAQVNAQVAKGTFFETAVRAYGLEVGAWAQTQNNLIEQQKLYISEKDLNLRGWLGQVTRYEANIREETARVGSVVSVFDAFIREYAASAQVSTAASESNIRQFLNNLERSKAQAQTNIQNVLAHIEQLKANATISVTALDGAARAAGQLAAASFSAVHFSAGVTSGITNQTSCATDFQYLGQAPAPS